MSHKYNNPVISALDDIASELEKTGNADLASLVDEVAAEVLVPRKPVTAKAKPAAKPVAKPAAKPASRAPAPTAKRAETNVGAKRARIASAMRKIARAQVSELEDIAQELIKEGDKRAALEVLKIAEDLDSEYEYSGAGKHKAPASKGDASKVFDKAKANKPDAKMSAEEKEKLETPFGASDAGYPLNANKKSKDASFDRQLEALIRLASEEDPELDAALPAEEDLDAPAEEEADDDMADDMGDDASDDMADDMGEDEEESEDADDADLEGLEGLDMGEDTEEPSEDLMDLGEGDGEDELAAMMDAMGEDEDVDASSDRMYDADAAEDEEEPAFGEEEETSEDPMGAELDEDEDEEASAMGALQGGAAGASLGALGGPAGAAIGGLAGGAMGALTASVDKKKILALAQKLASRGEKGLAARVARLAKK